MIGFDDLNLKLSLTFAFLISMSNLNLCSTELSIKNLVNCFAACCDLGERSFDYFTFIVYANHGYLKFHTTPS